jgi:small subunit ribosomal protein S20
MAEAKKEATKKQKRPTAIKRDIQSLKRQIMNKSFKARVNTAIRGFEGARTAGEQTSVKEKLKTIYSLVDKGVKTGVFKINKAARMKSRLTARASAK